MMMFPFVTLRCYVLVIFLMLLFSKPSERFIVLYASWKIDYFSTISFFQEVESSVIIYIIYISYKWLWLSFYFSLAPVTGYGSQHIPQTFAGVFGDCTVVSWCHTGEFYTAVLNDEQPDATCMTIFHHFLY